MTKILTTLTVIVVILSGAVIGFLAGAQSNSPDWGSVEQIAIEQSARAFYAALNELDEDDGPERLAALLAPDFNEHRVALQQTLDRPAFLTTIAMEYRTFPERTLIPIQIGSNGAWAIATVHVIDNGVGSFAGIEIPPSARIRREMLNIVDGQIRERIVLDGDEASFQSLPVAQLPYRGIGMQTIEIVERTYTAHAHERFELNEPALFVSYDGRFTIGNLTLEPYEAITITRLGSVEITNVSNEPAELALIRVGPAAIPQASPGGMQQISSGVGVTVQRIAQSESLFMTASCIEITSGVAFLAPGTRLPAHDLTSYELLIPTAGILEARIDNKQFFRSDSQHAWQNQTSFTNLEPGITTVAPPGSRTHYLASGNQPTTLWLYTVDLNTTC